MRAFSTLSAASNRLSLPDRCLTSVTDTISHNSEGDDMEIKMSKDDNNNDSNIGEERVGTCTTTRSSSASSSTSATLLLVSQRCHLHSMQGTRFLFGVVYCY